MLPLIVIRFLAEWREFFARDADRIPLIARGGSLIRRLRVILERLFLPIDRMRDGKDAFFVTCFGKYVTSLLEFISLLSRC